MTAAAARSPISNTQPVTAASGNVMLTLGCAAFCFYLFVFYSRVLDRSALAAFHLPAISMWVAAIAAVLSGRLGGVLGSRTGLAMAGLTVCLMAAITTSYWRAGSVNIFTAAWIPMLMMFAAGATLVASPNQCRRALYAMGFGTAVGSVIVMVSGGETLDRLVLEGSRFANSNTIAIVVLMGMPMVCVFGAVSNAGNLRKIITVGLLVPMLMALFRSGSREGIIGLGFLLLTAFLRSSPAGKFKLAAATIVLLTGSLLFLPHSLKVRFATILQGASVDMPVDGDMSREDQKMLVSAAGSSLDRFGLLITSLKITAQHPLLGIGPGQFSSYTANLAKSMRIHATWNGTHNTYTQVSSEVGIPAFCFYVMILFTSMRALTRIYKRARRLPGKEAHDIAVMAVTLHASFIAYCVCAFFNHMAYEPQMAILAAIAIGLSRAAPETLSRLEQAVPQRPEVPQVTQAPYGRFPQRQRWAGTV